MNNVIIINNQKIYINNYLYELFLVPKIKKQLVIEIKNYDDFLILKKIKNQDFIVIENKDFIINDQIQWIFFNSKKQEIIFIF